MESTLARAARILSEALTPLAKALAGTDNHLLRYVRSLGWILREVPPALKDLRDSSNLLVASLAKLENELRRDGSSSNDTSETEAEVLVALALFTAAMRGLEPGFRTQLPAPFVAATRIDTTIKDRIFEDALSRQLEYQSRDVYLIARVLGLVESTTREADPSRFQPAYEERLIKLDRLPQLVSDPAGLMRDVYGWGTATLDRNKLFLALRDLSFAFLAPASFDYGARSLLRAAVSELPDTISGERGLRFSFFEDTPLAFIVGLYPFPKRRPDEQQGLVLTFTGLANVTDSFAITPSLSLSVNSEINLASGIALAFWPDRSPKILGNISTAPSGLVEGARATIAVSYAPPDETQRVPLLSFSGFQMDVKGLSIHTRIGMASGAVDASVAVSANGLRVQLEGLGQDPFLSDVLPNKLTLEFDLVAGWSTAQGLHWQNSVRPSVEVPIAVTIGPVKLRTIEISVASTGDAYQVGLGVFASTQIGPVSAEIAGVGVAVSVNPQGGNLGPLDVVFSGKPPEGVGLVVDAAGVTGGGFLFHDAAQHTYAGALQLTVQEHITLKAVGLIETRMPDGSKGYSLLIFITAEDFKPIPLGMGFTLHGIGGMLAINRTFDEVAMREGLKAGALATLLFPKDPVGNAPEILRNLATMFPAKRGSYLFGPLAKIGWGPGTLIHMDLGLIFEFGPRERLIVLGRISSILPSAKEDLLRLNIDVMGLIDFDEGTASLDGALVDSRLLHKFVLTGSMAMRMRLSAGPGGGFAMAVGGFNPRFAPPMEMPKLDRITINLTSGDNPRFTCEAYYAMTPNTNQFGARAQLYAAAYGFSVEGDVGFDVLVQLLPYHFLADFHASIQLKRGSRNLFKVAVEGVLEGPLPLRLSAKATFEILWCDFSIHFDKALVDGHKPPLPPGIDVLAELMRALASEQSWSTQRAANRQHGITLRKLPPSTALVLDPLGNLMVKQSVVPLNTTRDIDFFGGAPVAGARKFQISASLDGEAQQGSSVKDLFAPAQFFDMSDDEKLSSPSFDEMDAGLIFGSDVVSFDPAKTVAAPLEYESIVIGADGVSHEQDGGYSLTADRLFEQCHVGAAATARIRRIGVARFRQVDAPKAVKLNPQRWVIASTIDASTAAPAVTPGTSWIETRTALVRLNRADPRGGANWQVIPMHEVLR